MKFNTLFKLTILILAIAISFTSYSEENVVGMKEKGQLLFFLNPNGGPCKKQDSILRSIEGKIESEVVVKRISTTHRQDKAYFYQFGVRSLPLLVLVDSKGNVIKRFSPGIKDETTIMNSIDDCQCS